MDKPTSLYLLIAAYWQRLDDLTEAMHRTDACERDTPERDAAFAAQMESCDLLTEAEIEIAAFVPVHRYDAKVKTEFLLHLASANLGTLEADVTAALLSSLSDLVKWSGEIERASA